MATFKSVTNARPPTKPALHAARFATVVTAIFMYCAVALNDPRITGVVPLSAHTSNSSVAPAADTSHAALLPSPSTMLLLPVVKTVLHVFDPMQVLLPPVVIVPPATFPSSVFELPVVTAAPAPNPTAVFADEFVAFSSVCPPTPTLRCAVPEIFLKLSVPMAVIPVICVSARFPHPAETPK